MRFLSSKFKSKVLTKVEIFLNILSVICYFEHLKYLLTMQIVKKKIFRGAPPSPRSQVSLGASPPHHHSFLGSWPPFSFCLPEVITLKLLSLLESTDPDAEFQEFESRLIFATRLKYGWFDLKLYSMFQDLNRFKADLSHGSNSLNSDSGIMF